MNTRVSIGAWAMVSLLLCGSSLYAAQPTLPFSLEQLKIGLPEAGAPRAVVGPYAVITETIPGSPGLLVYRPRDLANFPGRDTLPIVVWGNGACMADGRNFAGYLSTIASYGFLAVTTAAVPNDPQARIASSHLIKALDWAQADTTADDHRVESPDGTRIAVFDDQGI
jgi:hypothetical protein